MHFFNTLPRLTLTRPIRNRTKLTRTYGFLKSTIIIGYRIWQITTSNTLPTQPTTATFTVVFILSHLIEILITLTTHFANTILHIKIIRKIRQITYSSPRKPRPNLFY
ncbi:1-phosphatidylinositol-3-phosphate 5-kinase FAB1B [Trifolium repens]|nr:1-phosphatidylinositol-3-phosphate 5-kinase FAB1B [Trifolium repens]